MTDAGRPPPDARALYPEAVLDHGQRPRNAGKLEGATHAATVDNPLCGDRVTVALRIEGDRVREARFEARGCLLAKASASLLTEALRGRSLDEVGRTIQAVELLVGAGDPAEGDDVGTPRADTPAPPEVDLGPLVALGAARDFPARRACVALPWSALRLALAGGAERS